MSLVNFLNLREAEIPNDHWHSSASTVPFVNAKVLDVGWGVSGYRYFPGRYDGTTAFGAKGATANVVYVQLLVPAATVNVPIVAGVARWQNPQMNIMDDVMSFQTASGTNLATVKIVGTTGMVRAVAGPQTVDSVATAPHGLWHYIEAKYYPANTGGYMVVKLNGKTVIEINGDTYSPIGTVAPVAAVNFLSKLRGSSTGTDRADPQVIVGDPYIVKDDGVGHNDFLGEVTILRTMPSANGLSSDLVGSDGDSVDNYALVSSEIPDLNRYVSSSTPGDTDLYNLGDLPQDPGNIVAVRTKAVVSKTELGASSASLLQHLGSEDAVSESLSMPVGSLVLPGAVRETTPLGVSWTPEDVNSLQAGIRIQNA